MTRGCVYVIYEAGNFRPALDLCVAIRNRQDVMPVLFSPYYLPDTEKYIEQAKNAGIAYIHEVTPLGGLADMAGQLRAHGLEPSAAAAATDRLAKRPNWFSRVRNRLAASLLEKLQQDTAAWEAHYRARTAVAAHFLSAINADLLILPEDNVERDSACWCQAIHDRSGRAVVASYGSITPHEAAVAYFDNPDYVAKTAQEKHFLQLYPQWKMVFKQRTMLRLPVARAYAMERLGLAPRRPWVVNTGALDGIVVESEFMRSLFARHGIPAQHIFPTGHSAFDALANAATQRGSIHARWQSDFGYDPARPVLLCAMPPDQYPGVPAPEFASYEHLVDSWLAALDKVRAHFFPVISPHPNIAAPHLNRMRAAGFPVLEGGVVRWLPACDLYVASVSSTIKWARACGKAVLNYDCYRYAFDDYVGAPGVYTFFDLPAFEAGLQQLTQPQEFSRLRDESQKNSTHWGILDGQAMNRLVSFLYKK